MGLDTKQKFSKWTVLFHWAVAISIISLLCVGMYMVEHKAFFLYRYHKSFGVLVFLIVIARILWRFKNGWPNPLSERHAFELRLVRISHWILIVSSIMMPISGIMMSSFGEHGLHIFDLEILPVNYVNGTYVPINAGLSEFGAALHHWLKWLLIVTIVLHVAGALKHHFIYKDGTLRRMLGQRID